MADTVDDARKRLAYVLNDYTDELAEDRAVSSAIDKLIAAVRAEKLWHCAVCGGTLTCDYCQRGIVAPELIG